MQPATSLQDKIAYAAEARASARARAAWAAVHAEQAQLARLRALRSVERLMVLYLKESERATGPADG